MGLETVEHPGFNGQWVKATGWPERVELFAWAPCLLLLLLAPWPVVKVLAGFALLLSLSCIVGLSRSNGIVVLGALFALAYLFSPYWLVPATATKNAIGGAIGHSAVRIATACVLFGVGTAWAWLAAGEIPRVTDRNRKDYYLGLVPPAILGLFVLLFNYAPLYNNIPVQGDEIYHVSRLATLRNILQPLFEGANLGWTVAVTALVAGFFVWPPRLAAPIKLLIVCAIGLFVCLVTDFPRGSNLESFLVRYPFVSCWFHQLGPVLMQSQLDEATFRLAPMMATFAIAWFTLWALRKEGGGTALGVFAGLAFALTPNIHYHSTILYLEMPAVALLTIALYSIESILKDSFESVRRCPGWYALIAVGFLKETVVILVLGVIGLRLLFRSWILLNERRLSTKVILDEAAAVFCMAVPLVLYLFFRMYFSDIRGYEPHFENLGNASLYAVAGRALFAQFGGVLLLVVGGVVICLLLRRFLGVVALLLLFAADFFFHFMDRPEYVGLARFNLFLFAPLAVLALWFMTWLAEKNRTAAVGVGILCLVLNLALSPVAISGEKKPMWASPLSRTAAEFYFPYVEAVDWLKVHRPHWPVLVGGAYYTKGLIYWYFQKASYHPKVLSTTLKAKTPYADGLEATITDARKNGYPLVLFHKMEGGPALTDEEKSVLGYTVVKVFRNRYLAMVLYQTESAVVTSNDLQPDVQAIQ